MGRHRKKIVQLPYAETQCHDIYTTNNCWRDSGKHFFTAKTSLALMHPSIQHIYRSLQLKISNVESKLKRFIVVSGATAKASHPLIGVVM